ncbi:MAG: cytoplasmic protein [Planctomycetota bacterium]|nr:MAG: cytoplasmic protein [Planctomycetota bacterium]
MSTDSNASRREFLIRSISLCGAAALSNPRVMTLASGPASPPPLPEMAIARAGASGEVTSSVASRLTESAIAGLGGMQRFVSRGDVVWIKPNIGWNRKPELAANTHPDVVSTLVRLCMDAGAKSVKVGDYTCNDARQSYENSGIGPAAKAAGARVVFLEKDRFKKMAIGGERLKSHPVYPEIVECDLVVNVPVCKHHSATTVTLCMKNYMGVVEKRRIFHQDLSTTIADITRFMKPRLCVLDATRILTAHGPTGGNIEDVKVLNTVAAGTDIVALDAFGCELLGHKAAEISTVARGAEYGLGRVDYRSLMLRELQLP